MPPKSSTSTTLIFATKNPFGDTVTLETSDWTGHILVGHPEMAGKEMEVKAIVEGPDRIRASTKNDNLIYEGGGTSSGLIRVVLAHDDPTKAITGGTTAGVVTAFPRDPARFPSPNVGTVVWTNPKPPGGKP